MVPGAPSVMTTGPLLRPVWPAGPWASLEPGLPTLLPIMGPDLDDLVGRRVLRWERVLCAGVCAQWLRSQ